MKKRQMLYGYSAVMLLSVTLLLSGCGKSVSEEAYRDVSYDMAETAAEAEAAYDYAAGVSKLSANDAGASDSYDDAGTDAADSVSADAPKEKKLIRTVDVSLETSTFDETVQRIRAAIEGFGGYIENSGIYYGSEGQQGGRSASFTARIPAEQTDAFLSAGFGEARIVSRNEQTEDVSLKYTDLETKLASLKTEESRLLELMAKAEDVDSLIALEERLSEIRYETENIQSRLKTYDNQVIYSTVYLYVNEVRILPAEQQDGFFTRIATGFKESTASLLEALEDFIVWLCSNILTLLLIAVLFSAVIAGIRKLITGMKHRKAELRGKTSFLARAESEAGDGTARDKTAQDETAQDETAQDEKTPDRKD